MYSGDDALGGCYTLGRCQALKRGVRGVWNEGYPAEIGGGEEGDWLHGRGAEDGAAGGTGWDLGWGGGSIEVVIGVEGVEEVC